MKKLLALCLFSLLVSGNAYANHHEKDHDDHDKAAHGSTDAPHKGKKDDKQGHDHGDDHADGEMHDDHGHDDHHSEDAHH